MKIKTGDEIYLEGCDVREQSEKRDYDDYSTKERSRQHQEKWVSVNDMVKALKLARYWTRGADSVEAIIQKLGETK